MNWIVFAALFGASCTAPPPSDHVSDVDKGGVNMRDIDTSSEAGADRLLRRIRDAAQVDCDIRRGPQHEATATRDHACLQAAMANDVALVQSRILSARFARVGAAMIATAAGRPEGHDREVAVIVQPATENASAIGGLNARMAPSNFQPTTDDLNRRESARLRGLNSSD